MISDDVLKRVLARPLPTVAERADRLLLEAVRGQDRLGSLCANNGETLLPG